MASETGKSRNQYFLLTLIKKIYAYSNQKYKERTIADIFIQFLKNNYNLQRNKIEIFKLSIAYP